jgi:hypothetical protein
MGWCEPHGPVIYYRALAGSSAGFRSESKRGDGLGTSISGVPLEFHRADSETEYAGLNDRYGRMVRDEWPRTGIATAPPAWEQDTAATAWPLTTN